MTQAVPFVHLRMHSEFSLIDSMIRIKPLMKALQAEQMPAIALTDQSTMSGMIKFYKAAQSAGIKPICGCDVFIAETTEADATISRMTLLAMDSKGYLNLTELVSRSFQEGQIDGKAIIQMVVSAGNGRETVFLEKGEIEEIGAHKHKVGFDVNQVGVINITEKNGVFSVLSPRDLSSFVMATETAGTIKKDSTQVIQFKALYRDGDVSFVPLSFFRLEKWLVNIMMNYKPQAQYLFDKY